MIGKINKIQMYANILYENKKGMLVCVQNRPMIWYLYEDGLWNKFGENIGKYITDVLITLAQNDVHNIHDMDKLMDYNYIVKIVKAAAKLFKDVRFYEKLDSSGNLFSFGEHVYDFKTNEYRPSLPTDYCSLHTHITYDDVLKITTNDVNNTLTKLKSLFGDDLQNILDMLSSLLVGHNGHNVFYVWENMDNYIGQLIIEYMSIVMGDYFVNSTTKLLTHMINMPNPDLAKLKGRKMVIFGKPQCMIKTATLKRFISCDIICVRDVYGDVFRFIPQFKCILIDGNNKYLDTNDIGIQKRMVVINWEKYMANTDRRDNYMDDKEDILYHGSNLIKILLDNLIKKCV